MAKGKYEQWLTPEGLLKLEGWARDGLTDEQIAQKIGIHRDTLNEWKKKYSDISDTLKRGKEVVDLRVENALLKRALGYEYEEVSEKYESGTLTEKKVTKNRWSQILRHKFSGLRIEDLINGKISRMFRYLVNLKQKRQNWMI